MRKLRKQLIFTILQEIKKVGAKRFAPNNAVDNRKKERTDVGNWPVIALLSTFNQLLFSAM